MDLSGSSAKILVIDDEPDMLSGFTSILSALGLDSVPVQDGFSAIEFLKNEEFDLIFCDLLMPGMDGTEIIKEAEKLVPQTPVIIFTAYGTIERVVVAMKAGAFDFLEKPVDTEKLKIIIEKGLRQRKLYRERENLIKQLDDKFRFDNIIGKSTEIRKVFEMIESVSNSDANILITGESGTGKELIARSIHAHSTRKINPFVPVNCGALPEYLFEAELFGYEKGAFTGAAKRKIGLLEYANGGTFFLDEVCEMNSNLQVKLLRVLQDHKLRRLGGNELIKADFRIISATNRDPEKMLEEDLLRKDFYYRLNVIHIHLPPLRERKDDIILLAEYFLDKNLKLTSKDISGFSEEVKEIFESYSWPGNIREMENVIERSVALSKGKFITANELPESFRSGFKEKTPTANSEHTLAEVKQKITSNIERRYLLSLLEKYKGNVTKVSEEAGMTRRNIHRLLKNHGLDPEKYRHE
ncbi:MAG: sigma-54-dependent Fis family transcriptional regulator [Ignavibacteriales bacterium]|nr:MAG: sigma-54-dependent Fis family transcriptional regulator [Ignavibacteriales bacterium]